MEWAPAMTAISTAAIALVLVAVGIVTIALVVRLTRLSKTAERFMATLEREAGPTIQSVRSSVQDANSAVSRVTKEIHEVVDTSRDLRGRVTRAIDAAEDRLIDAEALFDVMHEEVEETVLDIAAALRTTRRGSTVLRKMKRAFLGGRRR